MHGSSVGLCTRRPIGRLSESVPRHDARTTPPERFEAVEDPERSAEGYRIVWYRSSEKWRRDEQARENAIHEARWGLRRLAERVGKHKLKRRQQVQQAVD